MNNGVFKSIVKFKLNCIDKVIDQIPLSIGDNIKSIYIDFISEINEETSQYIQNIDKKSEDKKLKSINIK